MDPLVQALLQYGAVGVMAIVGGIVSKMLFDRWSTAQTAEVARMQQALDREKERADRLEAELVKLNQEVRSGYVGALTQATQATADAGRAVALAMATVSRG